MCTCNVTFVRKPFITCRPTNLEPEECMDEGNEEDDDIQDGDALDSADDMDDDSICAFLC